MWRSLFRYPFSQQQCYKFSSLSKTLHPFRIQHAFKRNISKQATTKHETVLYENENKRKFIFLGVAGVVQIVGIFLMTEVTVFSLPRAMGKEHPMWKKVVYSGVSLGIGILFFLIIRAYSRRNISNLNILPDGKFISFRTFGLFGKQEAERVVKITEVDPPKNRSLFKHPKTPIPKKEWRNPHPIQD
eukprot:TRINITY_DN7567_c0_g1_i1.p1 TRINITY_DN7567_c0_g1~~TRINITY_DN7567_c0_g1_i1.p1  ORF type:complete len:210 (-),score=31.61 TRINITY_DN7567_c0_g1_i1:165-725(-)